MKIELGYKKLLAEHKLTEDKLNEDAITGINSINEILKGINMLEKRGKEPTAKAISKIKSLDKWICYEIMDIVDETNKNDSVEEAERLAREAQEEIDKKAKADAEAKEKADKEAKEKADKEKADKEKADAEAAAEKEKDKNNPDMKIDPKGLAIEKELEALLAANKITLTIDEVKTLAPTAYGVIFNGYKDGEDNGVATSKYILKETEKEKFSLIKI